ncbi:hypothetical protein BDV98DRAFT_595023 [Pterulicium gracile]|uniref:Uncharacterized protein n=1 Tax=Pterulicium gracile TaxID=1884261 RepID=A0A5C3QE31_9AGAR|nr:hypothetical protein BDV98DRAFT_595023 [Pterula gracilis]
MSIDEDFEEDLDIDQQNDAMKLWKTVKELRDEDEAQDADLETPKPSKSCHNTPKQSTPTVEEQINELDEGRLQQIKKQVKRMLKNGHKCKHTKAAAKEDQPLEIPGSISAFMKEGIRLSKESTSKKDKPAQPQLAGGCFLSEILDVPSKKASSKKVAPLDSGSSSAGPPTDPSSPSDSDDGKDNDDESSTGSEHSSGSKNSKSSGNKKKHKSSKDKHKKLTKKKEPPKYGGARNPLTFTQFVRWFICWCKDCNIAEEYCEYLEKHLEGAALKYFDLVFKRER